MVWLDDKAAQQGADAARRNEAERLSYYIEPGPHTTAGAINILVGSYDLDVTIGLRRDDGGWCELEPGVTHKKTMVGVVEDRFEERSEG